MAKGKKYYVVWQGAKPGIYDSWDKCKSQINGFPGARYKSFKTRSEAETALANPSTGYPKKRSKASVSNSSHTAIIQNSLSVDAACSGNPGRMEYRGVYTKTKVELFRLGPFEHGTNNVGEFLALVHGLAFLKKSDQLTFPIYSDSRTAMAWVRKKKMNSTLQRLPKNEALFVLVDRAEQWLKTNTYQNPIYKWETKIWGEIPADFGRK